MRILIDKETNQFAVFNRNGRGPVEIDNAYWHRNIRALHAALNRIGVKVDAKGFLFSQTTGEPVSALIGW